MAGEDILPPADQVSAGGAPAPADSQAIVEALRSGGTMPGAALANLQQPPPQQYALPLANIGSAIGSGGLAAMGGRPGTNPYLTGLDDQQRSLFYQQLHAQQEQDRRTDRAFAQNKTLLTIEKGVLDSLEEGPLKDKLAQQYAQRLSQFTGNPLLGGVGAALATKKLSTEQLNGVLMDGAQKMDPQLIAMRRQIPVDKVQQILSLDPKYLERLGADDARTLKSKALDLQIKEATLAEKTFPELKKDPMLTTTVLSAHRQLTGGKDYTEGTDESRAAAYRMGVLQQRKDELAKFEQEQAIKFKYNLALQQAKPTASDKPIGEGALIFVDKAGNPADPMLTKEEAVKKGYFAITPKELDGVTTAQQAMTILENLKVTADEMKQRGLFVERKGPMGLVDQLKIGSKRYMGDPETDKRLIGTWDSQKAQMVILLRQLGDKGVRALGAMSPAMDALNTNMGYHSVDAVLGQIESEARSLFAKSRTPNALDSTPTVFKRRAPADAAGRRQLTPEQYKALKAKGATDEQIQEKYALP